jgi:hypothetical protein
VTIANIPSLGQPPIDDIGLSIVSVFESDPFSTFRSIADSVETALSSVFKNWIERLGNVIRNESEDYEPNSFTRKRQSPETLPLS